jgi:hypothetical protein
MIVFCLLCLRLSEVMHKQHGRLNFVLPALRAGHDGAFVTVRSSQVFLSVSCTCWGIDQRAFLVDSKVMVERAVAAAAAVVGVDVGFSGSLRERYPGGCCTADM